MKCRLYYGCRIIAVVQLILSFKNTFSVVADRKLLEDEVEVDLGRISNRDFPEMADDAIIIMESDQAKKNLVYPNKKEGLQVHQNLFHGALKK